MTIKNTDKNVSAENHEDVVVNASFNNGILTLIRKNLYDESTSAQKNIEVDLSDHKLKLKVLLSEDELDALKISTDPDDIRDRESYIFLVPFGADEEGVYREYIWVEDDEDFEVIGSTRVDLSNYVQKSDIENNLTTTTSGKVLDARQGKALADSKANSVHTHTTSDVTDFPTIPSKTSDLTNDGADGTNVFVSNNDSRLSDARTPTSHTHTKSNITDFSHGHGNITYEGRLGNIPGQILMTGQGGIITAISQLSSADVKHSSALSNIGSSADATQSTINGLIDTVIGNKANATHNHSSSNITDMSAVTVTITYTDNTTETLTLFKQVNNS